MKFKTSITILLGLAAMSTLGLILGGCGEDGNDPVVVADTGMDQYQDLDFSQEFGGLTVSDELEAFDDQALLAMMFAEDGEAVDDPMADDPEVLEWETMGEDPADPEDPTRPRFTFLRLRWGMIHGPDDSLDVDGEDLDPLTWTGEIHTDRGLVIVRRVLAFERPSDHLIFPRLNPRTVAFVSHTRGHFDGLLLQIIERPGDFSEENLEPNRLHINTGPFAGQYNLAELGDLDEMIDVDEVGNRLQLTGFTLSDISYCPKGFLSGRFRMLPEDSGEDQATGEDDPAGQQLGTFAGLWTDLSGRITGFLRGGYGLNAEGERVFFGKYIGRGGQFRGRLRGHWEPAADDRSLAVLHGHWFGSAGHAEGQFRGLGHPVEDYPGGFFEGRWTTACDDEAEDKIQ